jgi:hypothetical protein
MRFSPVGKSFGYAPDAGMAMRSWSGFSGVGAFTAREIGAGWCNRGPDVCRLRFTDKIDARGCNLEIEICGGGSQSISLIGRYRFWEGAASQVRWEGTDWGGSQPT